MSFIVCYAGGIAYSRPGNGVDGAGKIRIFAFDRKKCAGPIVGMYMRQESYSDTIISSIDNRTHAEVSPGYAHG